jgi:hypothetical protein
MKYFFVFLLLLGSTSLLSQSIYATTSNGSFRLITEFKTANGIYQVIQNEKAELLEVNLSPRKLMGTPNFSNIYYYSHSYKKHIYSDDMKKHFDTDISGRLNEIGGRPVKLYFHAPDEGPYVLEQVDDLQLDIGMINGIEKINGLRVEYDFAGGRPIRIGSEIVDYIIGSRVVIK